MKKMEASRLDVILVLILTKVSCSNGQPAAWLNNTAIAPTAQVPVDHTLTETRGRDDGEDGGATVILACLGLELIIGIGLLFVFAVAVMLGSRCKKRSFIFMIKTSGNREGTHRGQQQQAAVGSLDSLRVTPPLTNPVEPTFTPVRTDDDLAYTITEIGPLFLRSSSDDDSDDGTTNQADSRTCSRMTRPKGYAKRPGYSPPPPPPPSGHTLVTGNDEPVIQYAQLELAASAQRNFTVPLREEKTEYAIILGELRALVNAPLSIYPN